MLKKFLSSVWIRTVLPLAVLPLAAWLQALYQTRQGWPAIPFRDVVNATNYFFLFILTRDYLAYPLGAFATGIIIGILWYRSRGLRRFGYWLLLFLLSVTLEPLAWSYAVSVHPTFEDMPPASPLALGVFWCVWTLALFALVVWDIRSRKKH